MNKNNNNKQIALIDNNILDKSLYVSSKKFWDIKTSTIKEPNGSETILFIATKEFINPATNKLAKQVITSKDRLPNHQDNLILNVLIHMAQKNKKDIVNTTVYEILKNLGWSTGKKYYQIVRESINIWYNLGIEFHNCFYTHENGHITLKSRIITHFEERMEDGKLEIHFQSKIFNLLIKNRFYTSLNIPDYKNLKSAFQRRLYEILIKSFNNKLSFTINWKRLKDKLEDESKYKAKFLEKLNRAIKAINEKTELKISIELIDDLIQFRLKNEEKVILFELLNWLLNHMEEEMVLKIKNTCKLKKNGDGFIMICIDDEIKEYLYNNPKIMKFIKGFRIHKVI